jgi:hypothetical protein
VVTSSATKCLLWLLLLSGLAAVAAFFRMFTGFSTWDDEGAMMITVHHCLSGMKLYDQVYTTYGPVYYFYNWLVHAALSIPADHDTTRMTSVVLMALCPLISAAMVMRLVNSITIASVVHLLTFSTLVCFRNEPGHPQELTILLLLGFVAGSMLATLTKHH